MIEPTLIYFNHKLYSVSHLWQGCLGIESLRNLHLFRSFCWNILARERKLEKQHKLYNRYDIDTHYIEEMMNVNILLVILIRRHQTTWWLGWEVWRRWAELDINIWVLRGWWHHTLSLTQILHSHITMTMGPSVGQHSCEIVKHDIYPTQPARIGLVN